MFDDFASPLEPSRSEFEELARRAIARIPAELRDKLERVVLKVEEFATAEQLASVGIESRWHLTGLYEGTPLPDQSVWQPSRMPPVISLFRQPLLREMRQTGVRFEALVHHVVIHEAGHHFGFSDEEMHALEDMVRD